MPEKIPKTKDVKPNRAMRRHPEKVEDEELTRAKAEEQQILKHDAEDDASARAKSSGHGKKTADKWNQ